jgi:hypothetical protein
VAKWDAWPTDEDVQLHTFYCHCNIIKTQCLIEFLPVTSTVTISVKLTKLFNIREDFTLIIFTRKSPRNRSHVCIPYIVPTLHSVGRTFNQNKVVHMLNWSGLSFLRAATFRNLLLPMDCGIVVVFCFMATQIGGTWRIG